jgi:hypothetical protein
LECKKSKYDRYEIESSILHSKLLEIYNILPITSLESIQRPITDNCIKEQYYRTLRENKLHQLPFEYPEVNQCIFDFVINNFKIQEKTAFVKKSYKHYSVLLGKNKYGIANIPYDQGDNHFYWINLQDEQTFYVIPEDILVSRNIISSGNIKGKRYLSFAKRNTWLDEYKYLYNEENINEILLNYFKLKST